MDANKGNTSPKRKKNSGRVGNDEEVLKRIKCQNEIKNKEMIKKVCGKIAVYKFSCPHAFCSDCVSRFKDHVRKEFIQCPLCYQDSRKDTLVILMTETEKQQQRQDSFLNPAPLRDSSEITAQKNKVLVHNLATCFKKHPCVYCSKEMSINLRCGHDYCAPCFVIRHRLTILEGYCCIQCFRCKEERWYILDELKKKAEKNGDIFNFRTTFNAGIESTDVDCFFRDTVFQISWKSLGYISKPFVITVWTNIHDKLDRTMQVEQEKDGTYQYQCNISTGIYFFRLAVKGNDLFPKWLGPIAKTKAEPPTIEGEIQAKVENSNCVVVSWNHAIASNFVKIDEYVVEKRKGFGYWKEYTRIKHPHTSCRATNLKHDIIYNFRVKVSSSVGFGPYGYTLENICIKSDDKGLPGPPIGVQIVYDDRNYNVGGICWQRPVGDKRSRVLSYVVYMKSISGDWSKINEQYVPQEKTKFFISCPFDRMDDFTLYTFKIVARNENGESEAVETERIMKKSNPLPPNDVIITEKDEIPHVVASWRVPTSDGGLPLQTYNIEIISEVTQQLIFKDTVDHTNTRTKIDISSFPALLNYEFRLTAENNIGKSNVVSKSFKTRHCKIDTVAGLPDPPIAVHLYYDFRYCNDANICWRQSSSDERACAQSYLIDMRELNSKNWINIKQVPVRYGEKEFSICCPFKRMNDHTFYTFKIVARNENGESEAVETEQVMKKSRPLPPKELDVMINGDIPNVLASWKPPHSNGGLPLQRYNFEIRSTGTKKIIIKDTVDYTDTKIKIDISSIPATTYELRLTAENKIGKSDVAAVSFTKESKKKEKAHNLQMTTEKKLETNEKDSNISQTEEKMKMAPIDKPEMPNAIKVNQDTSTSISIKWYIDNIKEHQPVTDFVIESRKHGQKNYEIVKTTPLIPDENWQTCVITGLIESTEYYFRVKARNKEGESEGICSDKIVMKKEEHVTDVADSHFEKDQVKEENDTPFCHGCEYQKALATRLTCLHQFCEECSIKLFKNALDSENGLEIIFYWKCNVTECGGFTDEKGVKFLAGNFLSQTWLEEKQKQRLQEKQNSPETEKEDYYDNVLAKNSDMSMIRGLPNVGMSCYANCIFQILGQTPYLMDHLNTLIKQHTLDKDKSISGQLVILLQDINGLADDGFKRRVGFDSVARLVDTICAKDESFIRGEQADSHSFMITLFNAIKEETQNKEDATKSETAPTKLKNDNDKQTMRKEASKTVTGGEEKSSEVAEPMTMFEGYMCNAFTFEGCSHEETSEPQMFNSILIPVKEGKKWSLDDGLKMVMKKEEHPIEELPCGKCEKVNKGLFGRNKTTKQQYFAKLPEILILQLGKFRQVYSSLTKMYKKVTYPYTLNMEEKQEKGKKVCVLKYNLYGVALHIGTLQYGGHYAVYVKRHESGNDGIGTDLWYYCSDSVVKTVPKENVIDDYRASILFYRRESV